MKKKDVIHSKDNFLAIKTLGSKKILLHIQDIPTLTQLTILLPTRIYSLSPFAYCRVENNFLLMESPLTTAKIYFHCVKLAHTILSLTKPTTIKNLSKDSNKKQQENLLEIITLLYGLGFIIPFQRNKQKEDRFTYWHFHELLFHAKTRLGFNFEPKGGTYRFKDKFQPLPAFKELNTKKCIPLKKININQLITSSNTFTHVIESRRTVRKFSNQPISIDVLGEFLYRTARIKEINENGFPEQLSRRPYPGGGANYELEIYVLFNLSVDVNPGIYYYHPYYHALDLITSPNECYHLLLKDAQRSNRGDLPPLLICITTKRKKLSWKYENISYAITLKNTGILLYNMALVATDMGLGSCILGCGNPKTFEKATGICSLSEPTIGELVLGNLN